MKKTILSMLMLSTVFQAQAENKYNVIITTEHSNYINSPIEKLNYSSCKEILDNGESIGNGIYEIENNNKNYDVYCDMTTNNGGWTMILAQFEEDIAINWNEGIEADYDPSLISKKSFTLNNDELPIHTQISFSQTEYDGMKTSEGYFNYIYSNGDIEKTIITMNTGDQFHIHRSSSLSYNNHDPDDFSGSDYQEYSNTLTIDKINTKGNDFAFSILHPITTVRGYSYKGDYLPNIRNTGAWILWVR